MLLRKAAYLAIGAVVRLPWGGRSCDFEVISIRPRSIETDPRFVVDLRAVTTVDALTMPSMVTLLPDDMVEVVL